MAWGAALIPTLERAARRLQGVLARSYCDTDSNRFISSPDQKTAATTGRIYINADFDTIEKALPRRKMAEQGAKTGLPWSIADFGSPA